MKKYIFGFLISFCLYPAAAQKIEGVITYNKLSNWNKIYQRLTYLSQEEKDRAKLTWGNQAPRPVSMKLVFNDNASTYTYASEQGETEDGRYSWKNSEYVINRDFSTGKQNDAIEMLGRVYLIEDTLRKPAWKIMNKIKDVAGHVCMMAVTEDTVRKHKITAWFADDLPGQAGPEGYFGLPGVILEVDVNDGDVVTTATKIELKPVDEELKPGKKRKGRKIDNKQYDALVYKHIQDNIKSKRYPYFSIPY